MIRVQVIRGDGDVEAPEQINPLSTQANAARELGRNYLDDNGFDKKLFDVVTPFRDMPETGLIAEVSESSLGDIFYAKITGWSISIDQMTETTPCLVRITTEIERSII